MNDTALQARNGSAQPAADEPRPATATVTPPVDVLENENELLVLADLPGVSAEHVDIRFENGELTVHGRRSGDDGPSYFRAFRVTEHVAADKIEADLRHGVLTLRLPKVEAVKPRRIAVKG